MNLKFKRHNRFFELEQYGVFLSGEKVAIIAIYPKEFTFFSLQRLFMELKLNHYEIVSVVNSNLHWKDEFQDLVIKMSNIVLVRENVGYDFGAWKHALSYITQCSKNNCKQLLLLNDSVYFTPRSLGLIERVSKCSKDWIALTASSEVSYHAQSYFQIFSENILCSKVFMNFWKNLKLPRNRAEAVIDGEVKLSQSLISHDFQLTPFFNIDNLTNILERAMNCNLSICGVQVGGFVDGREIAENCFIEHNPSHHFGIPLLIDFGFPIKLDLLKGLIAPDVEFLYSNIEFNAQEKIYFNKLLPNF